MFCLAIKDAGVNATLTQLSNLTSKKPMSPQSGPMHGLIVDWCLDKKGQPKQLQIETVAGTFQARVVKSQRPCLAGELWLQAPVRLWLQVKGSRVTAEYVVPLEPRQQVETGCSEQARQACIWVCGSKSCCRKGGSELLDKLKAAADGQPQLKVKKCDCLGTCKKGPSLKVKGDRKIHQVNPNRLSEWLERVLN